MVVAKAASSFAEAYHFIFVPIATKFVTAEAEQKVCAAADGAGVVFIVIETTILLLSEPFIVWVA